MWNELFLLPSCQNPSLRGRMSEKTSFPKPIYVIDKLRYPTVAPGTWSYNLRGLNRTAGRLLETWQTLLNHKGATVQHHCHIHFTRFITHPLPSALIQPQLLLWKYKQISMVLLHLYNLTFEWPDVTENAEERPWHWFRNFTSVVLSWYTANESIHASIRGHLAESIMRNSALGDRQQHIIWLGLWTP